MSNATFRHVVESLLQGKLICDVSDAECHLYLQSETALDSVNQYLSALGRGVAMTTDQAGYYCVYLDVEDSDTRSKLIRQFGQLATRWEALLLWLRLTRQISANAHPLGYKDTLKESELLASIEQSSSLQAELESIATRFQLRGRAGPRHRLTELLKFLCTEGFLIELSPSIYQGTARWSMLQDQMEFIRNQDAIQTAERDAEHEEQEALF